MGTVDPEEVVDLLTDHDVDTVFGIPGTQTLELNSAIDDSDVRYVMTRNETATSYAAWGYAETGGGMAATLVVPGPGDLYALNGLKNAYNDGTPLLHVAVETKPHLRGGDAIHETPPETYDPVLKENVTVETAASAVPEFERALAVARSPPTGPVRIGIPKNFLEDDGDGESDADDAATTDERTAGTAGHASVGAYRGRDFEDVPDEAIEEAVERLEAAEKPLVVAGGGIRRSGAAEALETFVKGRGIPVVTTNAGRGKGVFPENHRLAAGTVAFGDETFLGDADVVLAIGTDLDAVTTIDWGRPLGKEDADLIHVVLHPDDLGQGYDLDVGVVADAKAVLDVLEEEVEKAKEEEEAEENNDEPNDDWVHRAKEQRERIAEKMDAVCDSTAGGDRMTQADLIRTARDAIPKDAVVAAGVGGLGMWMRAAFDAYGPSQYLHSGSWASMGSALPGAIGASLANLDRDVVAMVGDGGLMMVLHELHTLVPEEDEDGEDGQDTEGKEAEDGGAEDDEGRSEDDETDFQTVVLVSNNSDYAIISAGAEDQSFDWPPIDFRTVAEGLGLCAVCVETRDELENALQDALEADGPVVVEAMTRPVEDVDTANPEEYDDGIVKAIDYFPEKV